MGGSKSGLRLCKPLFTLVIVLAGQIGARGASFSEVLFASGSPTHSTQPESIIYGNGNVWVAYDNYAPTRDYTGSGTIVEYNTSGIVENSYALAGSLGGLKYDPSSGQVWILQGQQLYSQLSVINPATKSISSYAFDQSVFVAGTRGFGDLAFAGNGVFLSETTPYYSDSSTGVIVRLNTPTLSSPIGLTTILTQDSLAATPARSLNSTPTGGVILTGSTDHTLTFVNNPGLPNQTATTLQLVPSSGSVLGNAGDALITGAVSGTFYLTDSGTNDVYAVSATGLDPNALFVNVGTEFGSVDLNTGVVTPILYGDDFSGMTFVPNATPTPEPANFGISLAGITFGLGFLSCRYLAKRLFWSRKSEKTRARTLLVLRSPV